MLLNDKLKNYRLLLGSRSPRRRELMSGVGLPYEVTPAYDCEEVYPSDLPLTEVSEYLSVLKSKAYPTPLGANEILLTADTVVIVGGNAEWCGGEILGKPKDHDAACAMLKKLSGRTHLVTTGVTLRAATHQRSFTTTTQVSFRQLTDEEITHYVDTFRPYDKAGAYGIQEWIGYAAIERIEGSFYNVMGLPIQKVYVELEKFITQ